MESGQFCPQSSTLFRFRDPEISELAEAAELPEGKASSLCGKSVIPAKAGIATPKTLTTRSVQHLQGRVAILAQTAEDLSEPFLKAIIERFKHLQGFLKPAQITQQIYP